VSVEGLARSEGLAASTARVVPRFDPNNLRAEDISRVVEMAWEDRTPFEAIEYQFGLTEQQTIELMRRTLKRSSFNLWRERVTTRSTKHRKLRATSVDRHRANHRQPNR
jgi:uncharacterized protein (TIGR03643 family)